MTTTTNTSKPEFDFQETYPLDLKPPPSGLIHRTSKRRVPLYYLGWKLRHEQVMHINRAGVVEDNIDIIVEYSSLRKIWKHYGYHDKYGETHMPQRLPTALHDYEYGDFVFIASNIRGEPTPSLEVVEAARDALGLGLEEYPVWRDHETLLDTKYLQLRAQTGMSS
ncbi:hypothetical protein V5O48_015036 [Marasmius crinis-equi]|uniref:Uncharacterized protein n=1 Tax=Marasmius crinis-equi TaxID=585013 RepID=A0ABR3EVL9_9AGAR